MGSNGFREATFQELINEGLLEIGDGYRAKNSELGGAGLIFLRAGHVSDTHIDFAGVERFHEELAPTLALKVAKPGDTVITTKGNSTGRTTFVSSDMPPFVYSPHLSFWRSRDDRKLVGGFLRYWSRGKEFGEQLGGMKASTDMAPYLSLTDQRRLRISLPPPSCQQAVARVLGALDDKIELNRRMNETLEGMARALFKSWFVDFDPVRAKLDGRPPPNLDPATAALFPDHFEHTNGQIIPKGWRSGQLRDLAGFQGGYAFKSKDWVDEGVPVVKIGSVKPGIVDIDDVSYVTPEIADEASRFKLDTGDLLIGMTGYVGEVGLIPPTSTPPLLNQRVGKFVLQEPGSAELAFIYCLTRGADFKTSVEAKSHGTAQANVSAEGILSVETIVPTAAIRNVFNRHCAPLLDRILENHGESRTLAALRDALLPKLLSGEIRIPAAEKIVEEVA